MEIKRAIQGLATKQDETDSLEAAPLASSLPAGGWTAASSTTLTQKDMDEAQEVTEAGSQRKRQIGWLQRGSLVAQAALGGGLRAVGWMQEVLTQHLSHPSAESNQQPAGAPRTLGRLDAPQMPEMDPIEARAKIDFILRHLPPKGDPSIPSNVSAAGLLLADQPPSLDFQAVDLLHDCFPRGTRNSDSRILMAAARNLTRRFGLPGRLPIAAGKAWTMLDPDVFNDEMAAQLAAISSFILDWQTTQGSFLILEFAEIELIEYLFENMHPVRHAALLIKVMEFKVLSARRVGLLRRIPARVRRFVQNPEGRSAVVVRAYVDDTISLLKSLSGPQHFSAVSMASRIALAELDKIVAQLETSSLSALAPILPKTQTEPQSLHPIMRGLGGAAAAPSSTLPVTPVPGHRAGGGQSQARRRFTKAQKSEAVMRVLRGEECEWVALSVGVTSEQLSLWQDAFLNGGSAALGKGKSREQADPSMDELKGQLHSLIKTVELLSSQMSQVPAAVQLSPPAVMVPEATVKPLLALPAPACVKPPKRSSSARKSKP